VINYFVNFKQAILGPYIEEQKNYYVSNLGKIVAIAPLFQVITTSLIGFIINRAPKRIFIMICFFLITLSNLLMGPSSTLGLQSKFMPLFFIGLAINGLSQGLFFTPMIPEMLDAIYSKQKIAEGQNDMLDVVLADRASAYYGVFICAGTITAPMAGSFVYETILGKNWPLTCEIFALVAAIFSVIYTVFNVLPDVHKEKQELEELKKALLARENNNNSQKSKYLESKSPEMLKKIRTLDDPNVSVDTAQNRKTVN
jgi:MFS family permease